MLDDNDLITTQSPPNGGRSLAQPPTNAVKRMFIVGQVSQTTINALAVAYLVTVAHQYQTLKELMSFGKDTLMNSAFDLFLIGEGISSDRRNQLIGALSGRPSGKPVVGVITDETQSYGDWKPVPRDASVETIAQVFDLQPRRNPAQIIIVVSLKGGVGKSSLAINLAVTLGKLGKGHNVVLLEDDWNTRSVAKLMGIEPGTQTSSNLVKDIERNESVVTPDLVNRYLVPAHGVNCLVGPASVLTRNYIEPDLALNILSVVGRDLGTDFVVVDAPPDFFNTSSFTMGLLRNSHNFPNPPLFLIPVVPETFLLNSVEDTLSVITYLKHPAERILPVINCLRPSHVPESLLGNDVLWREPAGIVPYCPEAEFVGDRKRPLVLETPRSPVARFFRAILNIADVQDVKRAYDNLAAGIVEFSGKTNGAMK